MYALFKTWYQKIVATPDGSTITVATEYICADGSLLHDNIIYLRTLETDFIEIWNGFSCHTSHVESRLHLTVYYVNDVALSYLLLDILQQFCGEHTCIGLFYQTEIVLTYQKDCRSLLVFSAQSVSYFDLLVVYICDRHLSCLQNCCSLQERM